MQRLLQGVQGNPTHSEIPHFHNILKRKSVKHQRRKLFQQINKKQKAPQSKPIRSSKENQHYYRDDLRKLKQKNPPRQYSLLHKNSKQSQLIQQIKRKHQSSLLLNNSSKESKRNLPYKLKQMSHRSHTLSYVDRIRMIRVDFLRAREHVVRKDCTLRSRQGMTVLRPVYIPLSPVLKTSPAQELSEVVPIHNKKVLVTEIKQLSLSPPLKVRYTDIPPNQFLYDNASQEIGLSKKSEKRLQQMRGQRRNSVF